jgi:hypothetical protein
MAIDHILPEYLLDQPDALREALTSFGLPSGFDLNSFENWLPSHGHCNAKKRDHIFRPTPLIQLWLDQARERAPKARDICNTSASERQISKAIGTLATGDKALPAELIDPIIQHYASSNSEQTQVGTKLSVPPRDTVDFSVNVPVYRFTPPLEVQLTSGTTVTFDQTQRPEANGPFTYTVTQKSE